MSCESHHDSATNALTVFMCIGITISYLPQHWRIISSKSSEGFSPWFLLLGSTSSASAMLNIIVVQWSIIKCCRAVSIGSCIEITAGVFQLFLVWALFVLILVLYMIYYPPHLKYVEVDVDLPNDLPPQHIKTPAKREEWKLSITLSWAVFIHIAFIIFITFMLLSTNPGPDETRRSPQLELWATFLGVSSAVLAALQYAPQIAHTLRMQLVGALSIPMMVIQTPGAILMILSVALRPGTNWTTWISYAVAGVMQGILLVMCIIFRMRQNAHGIDDFGHPIIPPPSYAGSESASIPPRTPAVEAAVGDAVHSDVRNEYGVDVVEEEDAPLLPGKQDDATSRKGLLDWFTR